VLWGFLSGWRILTQCNQFSCIDETVCLFCHNVISGFLFPHCLFRGDVRLANHDNLSFVGLDCYEIITNILLPDYYCHLVQFCLIKPIKSNTLIFCKVLTSFFSLPIATFGKMCS